MRARLHEHVAPEVTVAGVHKLVRNEAPRLTPLVFAAGPPADGLVEEIAARRAALDPLRSMCLLQRVAALSLASGMLLHLVFVCPRRTTRRTRRPAEAPARGPVSCRGRLATRLGRMSR